MADDFMTIGPAGGTPVGNQPWIQVGSVVAGFRIEQEIGRGGMGVVYKARDESLGRDVALKIISPHLSGDLRFRNRFIAESRIAASVDNPFVLPVHQAGESDGVLFMASRYVAGGDLESALAEGRLSSVDQANLIVFQMASALDAAHARGLVHRDVKPANILIDQASDGSMHCFLSDFGLSKALAEAGDATATGELLGSSEYMAPEQISGEQIDQRVDQYSLACVAFRMLYGYSPFKRETRPATLMAHLNDVPPWPDEGRAMARPAMKKTLEKALRKKPSQRFTTCRQFYESLMASLLHGQPLVRHQPPAKVKRSGNHWFRWSVAPVAVLIGVVAIGLSARGDGAKAEDCLGSYLGAKARSPLPPQATQYLIEATNMSCDRAVSVLNKFEIDRLAGNADLSGPNDVGGFSCKMLDTTFEDRGEPFLRCTREDSVAVARHSGSEGLEG